MRRSGKHARMKNVKKNSKKQRFTTFCISGADVLPSQYLEPAKFAILRILDLVDQNLSKFDDFGVVGKLTTRSIQIDD